MDEYPSYLISPEDVETIVVTPDLGGEEKEDQVESIELDLSRYFNSVGASPEKVTPERISGNQKLFYCRHCNFKNGEKKAVVGHLSLHAGTKPFQCRICGMVSNWKHVILRHVKMRHGGTLEDVRNRLNYTEQDNVIELVGYPELNEIRPRESAESTKSVPTATSTPKSEHQFQCDMCPYTCEKLCYMHFHVKQHQPREGANFKCPHCDYWVNFKKTLNRHLKVHEEEKEPQMPQIAYYETATNFGEEELEAAAGTEALPELRPVSKKFQCEFCPYSTDKKRHFLYHKQFHRPNKAALFKCEYCSYWAMHNHLITQHTKKCHTENVYGTMVSCIPPPTEVFLPPSPTVGAPETAALVQDSGENEIIMVEQNGKMIKMIKCRFCPMMNRRRSNVRSHEEMHSYEKHSRFPCSICNYQCNSQGVLTSHMKLHNADEATKHQELEVVAERSHEIDFDFLNPETFTPKSPPPAAPRTPASATPKRTFSYFCAHCPAMFKSRSDYETHSTFHGTTLPFPCDRCDYRARHKPHLHKHFLVHSEEYVARREAAQPSEPAPTSKATSPKAKEAEESEDAGGNSSAQMSSVNQMLLLEERETAMFLEKGVGKHNRKANQCPSCPATFQKPSVLSFHKYLHGVNGKYYCPHCDYSVNDAKNLRTHQKLHPVKAAPQRTVLKIFACNKCPAVFTKNNRYLKHIDAHGKDNKFRCERCDFSVNLLIQLVKHRNVHKKAMEKEGGAASTVVTTECVVAPEEPLPPPIEPATAPPVLEKVADLVKPEVKEKVTYCCNRCPYFHVRRDAMINHHKRHTANAAIRCPHCDYSTLQASFLRDHIKWHFQPQKLIKANSFMKYSELEVWSVEEGERLLLFKDHGEDKENDRFFSPIIEGNDREEDSFSSQGNRKEFEIDKGKQLEVVLTDVFNPSVKKRLNSELSSAPRAKRQKTRSSEESEVEARLLIANDGPPVLRKEIEIKEHFTDEDSVTPATVECGTCPFICPYEQRGLMNIHRNSHKPRQGAHFKCPHCPYWVNHRKTLRNHLRLHDRKRKQSSNETETAANIDQLNVGSEKSDDQGEKEFEDNDGQYVIDEKKPIEDEVCSSEPGKSSENIVDSGEQIAALETETESNNASKEMVPNKSPEASSNPEYEQEVKDAVENMLQETQNHRYQQVDFEEPIVSEHSEIVEDQTLNLESDMGNEETIEDGINSNDDGLEDVTIDTHPIANGQDDPQDASLDNVSEGDAEGMEISISGDGPEIEHSYAEFPETSQNSESTGQAEHEKLNELIVEPPILDKPDTSAEMEPEKKEDESEYSISSTLAKIKSLRAHADAIIGSSQDNEDPREDDSNRVIQLPDDLKETDKSVINNRGTSVEQPQVVVEKENGRKENTSTKDVFKRLSTPESPSTSTLEFKNEPSSINTGSKCFPKPLTTPENSGATILEEIFLAEEGMIQEETAFEDEEDDESHIDMDDLVVHEDTEEDNEDARSVEEVRIMDFEESFVETDSKEDPEIINMEDLVVHEESEDEANLQSPRDEKERSQRRDDRRDVDREIRTIDVNLNQEAIIADDDAPVEEFNEEEVSAADHEANDILMNIASDYFSTSNGEFEQEEVVEPILDNTVQDQDVLEPWNGETRSKSDVLANLLLNAGVYTDDD